MPSSEPSESDILRVLLVDDSASIRMLIEDKLNELSADSYYLQIAHASDGETALLEAEQCPFDLVLMDVEMPGMGGLAACRQLKKMGYPARIAMLSSKTSAQDHLAGRQAGCDNYMVKPPHDSDLRSILRLVSLRKQVMAC